MEALNHFFTSFDIFELIAKYFLNMIRPLTSELVHTFFLTFSMTRKFFIAHPTLIFAMLAAALAYGGYALLTVKRRIRLSPIKS
jgi:hypothetical protein